MDNSYKKWVKNLDDQDLFSLVRDVKTGLDGVSKEKENIIKQEIRGFSPKKSFTHNKSLSITIMRFGIAASVLVALSFFLILAMNELNRLSAFSVISSGTISVEKDNRYIPREEGAIHKQGETISTFDSSTYTLAIGGGLIRMNNDTRITLKVLSKKKVNILLEQGEILINTDSFYEKKEFSIATPNSVTSLGSIALVRYINESTYIALYQGTAEIETTGIGNQADHIQLEQGTGILLADNGNPVKTSLSEEIHNSLENFLIMAPITAPENSLKLHIIIREPDVSLLIDNNYIQDFDKKITLFLAPGDHTIRLEKNGFIPFVKSVHFTAPGEYTIKGILKQKNTDDPETGETKKRTMGKARELYSYTNTGNPQKSMIIGFAGSDDYIVAVTRTQLTWFDHSGNMIVEQKFDSSKQITFDSIPYIHENILYIPTIYKLLAVNIKDWSYNEIQIPGIMSDGLEMTMYKDILYIPYPDGLYTFNTKNTGKMPEAFIKFQNSLKPLATDTGLYLSSFLAKETALFFFDGTIIHRHNLPALSLCPPVKAGDYIITGDNSGTITKFTPDLRKVDSIKIGSGIISLIMSKEEIFMALTMEGDLYCISLDELIVRKKIKVDNIYDPGIYLYKHPVSNDKDILLGTADGEIIVIDCETFSIRERKRIGNEQISCSIFTTDNSLFAGTKNGRIIQVEYKK